MGFRALKAGISLLVLLLGGALVLSPATAQTPVPFTAYGTGASADDVVTVFVHGVQCGEDTADADGNWGPIQVSGEAPCLAEDGDTISFLLNGSPTNETETWSAGGAPANIALGTVLTLAPLTFQGGFIENGVNIGVWGGGSFDQLVQLADSEGCDVYSFWVTVSQHLVGYFDGAPDFANAEMIEVYPGELIPPGTVMLVVCGDTRSVAPAPFTAYGTGLVAGDHVEAFVDGVSCGEATADGAGQWGPLLIAAADPCAPEPGEKISFLLNGSPTNETETWMEGLAPADVPLGTQLTLVAIPTADDVSVVVPSTLRGAPPTLIVLTGIDRGDFADSPSFELLSAPVRGVLTGPTAVECVDAAAPGPGEVMTTCTAAVLYAPLVDALGSDGFQYRFINAGESSQPATVSIDLPFGVTYGVIDFEADNPALAPGAIVDAVGLPGPGGVRFSNPVEGEIGISAYNPSYPGQNAAMIYDATCSGGCSGGDDDLRIPVLGQVLIVSEDLDSSDPDDLRGARGQTIRVDFRSLGVGPVGVSGLLVADVEPNEDGNVTLYGAAGEVIATVPIRPFLGDNNAFLVPTDVIDVAWLDVTLGGSGAIDDIAFSFHSVAPPPEPSTAHIQVSPFHRDVRAVEFEPLTDLDIWITRAGDTLNSTTIATDSSGHADWGSVNFLWNGATVHASDGTTTKTLLIETVDLGLWDGGSVDDYVAAISGTGAIGLQYGVVPGAVVYIIGAPDFVNQPFIDAFPAGIPPAAEVEIVLVDGDGDFLLLLPFKTDASASFDGSLGNDFVCAYGFYGGLEVTLRIFDVRGGTELAEVTTPRSVTTICWTIDNTGVDLQPGMWVEVSNGPTTRGAEVFQETLGSWLGGSLDDYIGAASAAGATSFTDGTPAAGLTVWVIGAPPFVNQAFVDAHPDGFDPSVVEVQAGHAIRYPIFDDALTPVLLSDAPPPSARAIVQASVGLDYVCAYDYPTGFDITLIVRSTPGGSELGRFTKTSADSVCWLAAEHGIDLLPGMEVLVTDTVTVKSATLLQMSLGAWTGGTLDDYVAGATGIGATAIYGGSPGSFVIYVIGAPDFVNAAFVAAYSDDFDPTGVETMIVDGDGDQILFPLYDAATATGPSGPSGPTGPSGPAAGAVPVTPASGVPVPAGATFSVALPTSGFGLTSFSGGTIADLEVAAAAAGSMSVLVTADGRYVVLIVGAPDWVNGQFAALFAAGVPGGQAVLLIIR